MKRVNIHLNEDWLEELEDMLTKIRKQEGACYWARTTTKADLIRLAIAEFYKFNYSYIHASKATLLGALKEINA